MSIGASRTMCNELASRTFFGLLCVTKPHTAPTERKRRVESLL